MRNAELETLDGLSDLVVRSELGESAHRSEMTLVIGRSDPNDVYVALYQDAAGYAANTP